MADLFMLDRGDEFVAETVGTPTQTSETAGGQGTRRDDVVTVTETLERKCGPDVTGWLMWRIARNLKKVADGMSVDQWIKNLKTDWNFNDQNPPPWSRGPEDCAQNCPHSVTICGVCFDDSVPEDINFGATGAQMGFLPFMLHMGADQAHEEAHQRPDDPSAHAAMSVGMDIVHHGYAAGDPVTFAELIPAAGLTGVLSDRGKFCKIVTAAAGDLERKDCTPCAGPMFWIKPKPRS